MYCDDMMIRVQADWKGWQGADIRLGDLRDVHWCQPIGASRALLYGHAPCTCIVSGDIAHDCDRRSVPHQLLVCILKRLTVPVAYEELARRADQQRSGSGPVIGGRRDSEPLSGRYA